MTVITFHDYSDNVNCIYATCKQYEEMNQNERKKVRWGWVSWRVSKSDKAKYPNQLKSSSFNCGQISG